MRRRRGGGGGGIGIGLGTGGTTPPTTNTPELPAREALIARARSYELNTPYVPPPGDPLEHNTSGFAKTMSSAAFITGLDPAVAAESVGYFTGPYAQRKKVGTPVVDRTKKEVRITIPNGPTLTRRLLLAQRHGHMAGADLGLLHARRGRSGGADRSLARPRGGAPGLRQGRKLFGRKPAQGADAADAGGAGVVVK